MRKVQERMIVFPSGDLTLEGLYHKGQNSPAIVVGAPHPRLGGSMDSPVVAEIAFGAARDRHPTLRFNYRGVGASQGERLPEGATPEGEVGDFLAAIEELRATTGIEEIVAAGYSFGAGMALRAALEDPKVVGAILVAPPTRLLDFTPLRDLRVQTLVAAGTEDEYVVGLDDLVTGVPAIEVHRIPGANHFFDRGLVPLSRAINAFMAKLAP